MNQITPSDPIVFYLEDTKLVAITGLGIRHRFEIGDILNYNIHTLSLLNRRPKYSSIVKSIKIKNVTYNEGTDTISVNGIDLLNNKNGPNFITVELKNNNIIQNIELEPVESEEPVLRDYAYTTKHYPSIPVTSFGGKTKRQHKKRYSRCYKYSRRK